MSKTKYSTTEGKLPVHESVEVDDVTLTGHSLERWDERSPAWSMSPELAYHISYRCNDGFIDLFHSQEMMSSRPEFLNYMLEWKSDQSQDEIETYEVLFIGRTDYDGNECIVTVYPRSFIDNKQANKYLETLRNRWLDNDGML
jgi:hypothetical protein